MGNVLAFISVKGGVGKTTLALETASSLANDFGKKVLLVDANFSAPNVGLYLDMTHHDVTLHDALLGVGMHNAIYESHGFDVVPASLYYNDDVDVFKLKNLIARMRGRYDFVIIDSSPNYEELVPVVNAAEKVYVVTTPDHVTLDTSLKSARLAREQKTPIEGIIINKIRSPKFESDLEEVEDHFEVPVLAKIRDHKGIKEATFFRKPITVHEPGNCISREIRRFASALCGEPEDNSGFFQGLLPFKDLFHKERVNRELVRHGFYEKQL
jgi:MinD-like ATPase involved in chromosome partitioning or flagellar assembly